MERSSLIAIILGVVMALAGGWFTYDGMNKNDEMVKKLDQAKTELENKTKAATSIERKVTGLSGMLGFTELTNWLNREAFIKLWSEQIQNNADLTSKLQANGIDTSKMGLSEIAMAIALAVQTDNDEGKRSAGAAWFETARHSVQDNLDKKVEELRSRIFDVVLTTKGPEGEVPKSDAEQQKIQDAKDQGLYQLRTGPRPWTNPDAMREYLNSWGKRMASIKDEAKKAMDAAKVSDDKAWWNNGAKAASGDVDLNSFAEATPDKKPAVTDAKKLLAGLDALIVSLNKQIEDTNKARDDQRANLHAIIGEIDSDGKRVKAGSMSDEEAKKDSAIKDLQTQLTDLRGKITAKIQEGETALAALDKEITDETIKLNAMVKEKTDKIKELEEKLSETKERLGKLMARQSAAVDTTKSDGTFLLVDLEHGTGWVDLGRANTLFKGLRFEIFRIEKAGKRVSIGEMEVLEVGDVRSKVSITKILNPADPPLAGDHISNSAFDRKKSKIFSIAGQLKFKYSRDDMRRRLMEWGAQVSDDVTPATNILIVGDRYQEDPNWAKAMELGTPVMRERELYDSLGIE